MRARCKTDSAMTTFKQVTAVTHLQQATRDEFCSSVPIRGVLRLIAVRVASVTAFAVSRSFD